MRFFSAIFLFSALSVGAAEKFNVLFLFSDDQRADTIGALGNANVATPNIDGLVKNGTAFTRAYCMGSLQGAVCVPSRAMLMTGRTLFRVDEKLAKQGLWPEQFAKAGYTTFITGKWHNGLASVTRGFQQGQSIFLGGMTFDSHNVNVADLADGKLSTPRKLSKLPSETFADSAIEFLKKQDGAKPFVCYTAFNLPHDPRVAPQNYHDKYNAAKPPLPPNFLPQHPFDNGDMTVRDERLAPWPRTPDVTRQHLADYYAAIEFMDAQIGRILSALKESGQYEKTLIVFSSDHGLAIGSHGLFGKQNLYDHSMHAPLIFRGPGIPAGKQSDALCYLLDIFPTLGTLTGVEAPETSEGKSLVGAMNGKRVRENVFTAFMKFQRAVRDERWKLIVYPQINKMQLFDLQNDPAETKDLSAEADHANDLERMMALLKAEQAAADDTLPLTSENPKPAAFDFSKVK